MQNARKILTTLQILAPDITAWDELFKTFSNLSPQHRTDVAFLIDCGERGLRRHAISVPTDALNDAETNPVVAHYLACFLYNRLVTDGGKIVFVQSYPLKNELLIAELVRGVFEKQLRRWHFYCNFGDPIPIRPAGSVRIAPSCKAPSITPVFHPDRGCTLGVDIGGTRIKLTLMANGWAIHQHLTPVDNRGGGQALADQVETLTAAQIDRFAGQHGQKATLDGIGVAVAGVLKGQRIVRMTNFERHWAATRQLGVGAGELGPNLFPEDYEALNKLPIRLSLRFGIDNVVLINDADAFGFQEVVCQPGAHAGTVVVMTLGTGVGYVRVANGVIEPLPHQGGHIIVALPHRGDRPDELPIDLGCGHCGCLAAYASATAMVRQLQEAVKLSPVSVELINKVLAITKQTSGWLAVAVAEFAEIFPELEEVVLAGGVVTGDARDLILRFTHEALCSRFPHVAGKVCVSVSGTDTEWGGAIGAAQYANYLSQSRDCPTDPMNAPGPQMALLPCENRAA